MAGVFHVEFGLNDTILTRALEKGNYASAERLILDNANPSFLDEGCYQRTPLFICLCGMDEGEERTISRNLYLAKLLIERGANVNYRVPVTYFGCEYMGPGKTALDLIIDYYMDLSSHRLHWANNVWDGEEEEVVDVVVGLHKKYLTTTGDILDNLQDLIFIILRNGGDPNLLDENQFTPLHRAAILSADVDLLRLLCENGANPNAVDLHGNTPLLAMCDASFNQMYVSVDEDVLPPTEEDDVPSTCHISNVSHRRECLKYLVAREDVQVNAVNSHNQSALFHCFAQGDLDSSVVLLEQGADPSVRGTVWEAHRKKRLVSPLFTCFMWSKNVLTAVPREVAHIVDKGYFNKPEIGSELVEYLEEDFPQFSHLYPYASRLIPLMFGGVTSSLSQSAARVIFRQSLLANTRCLQRILPVATFQNNFDSEELQNFDMYGEYVTMVLNRTVVRSLVQLLGLPVSSTVNFEIELLLHQMAYHFAAFKLRRPESVQSDDDYTDSDESVNTEEGDSDLEYW